MIDKSVRLMVVLCVAMFACTACEDDTNESTASVGDDCDEGALVISATVTNNTDAVVNLEFVGLNEADIVNHVFLTLKDSTCNEQIQPGTTCVSSYENAQYQCVYLTNGVAGASPSGGFGVLVENSLMDALNFRLAGDFENASDVMPTKLCLVPLMTDLHAECSGVADLGNQLLSGSFRAGTIEAELASNSASIPINPQNPLVGTFSLTIE